MKFALEALTAGGNREDAVVSANRLYSQKWGNGKIIEMRGEDEAA